MAKTEYEEHSYAYKLFRRAGTYLILLVDPE